MRDKGMSTIIELPLTERDKKVINRLKVFYQDFSLTALAGIDELYTRDVEFIDPVHRINGSLALKGYLRKMATNLLAYEIRYLDSITSEDSAYLSWEMTYTHKRLNGGKPIVIRGMSHVRFTTKIYYHEDCYDLSALVHDHVPVLGAITSLLRKRLSAGEKG